MVKNTAGDELTPCSTEHGGTNRESSTIFSEIMSKEDHPEENTEEVNIEDNKEGKSTDPDDSKPSDTLAFIAESLPQSPEVEDDSVGVKKMNINDDLNNIISSQENISCQTNTSTNTRENDRKKQTVMSTLGVPSIQLGRVSRKTEVPTPPQPKEKDKEALENVSIAPNEKRTNVAITIQPESEHPGEDDNDGNEAIAAEDVLCFAWQIAEGMVSGQVKKVQLE